MIPVMVQESGGWLTRYHQISPDITRYHQISPEITLFHLLINLKSILDPRLVRRNSDCCSRLVQRLRLLRCEVSLRPWSKRWTATWRCRRARWATAGETAGAKPLDQAMGQKAKLDRRGKRARTHVKARKTERCGKVSHKSY